MNELYVNKDEFEVVGSFDDAWQYYHSHPEEDRMAKPVYIGNDEMGEKLYGVRIR